MKLPLNFNACEWPLEFEPSEVRLTLTEPPSVNSYHEAGRSPSKTISNVEAPANKSLMTLIELFGG